MIYIAHRGNVRYADPSKDNSPNYIQEALDNGFDIEIDIWKIGNGKFMLGHDYPKYIIPTPFLIENKNSIWAHAKNIETLQELLYYDMNCFANDRDEFCLTSKQYIWTWKLGKPIIVLKNHEIIGFCADNIETLRDANKNS